MNDARVVHQKQVGVALVLIAIFFISFASSGCQPGAPQATEAAPTSTLSPTAGENLATAPSLTQTPDPLTESQPTLGIFDPPGVDPATEIPPALTGLDLSDEILVWMLLGSDTEPPFTGRTQAIHLLFIHPRFSKASLVSIPGNLYVYIPGYTMQRLNTAYAIGGIDTLRDTLAYNFGIKPSRFVLAHPGDLQWLVDDLDTVNLTVFYPIPQFCGGIRAGLVQMDGPLALCYASYIDGMDEVDRMQRQQQLLRVIFRKLTVEGYVTRLPLLYASYEGWIKTDLSLEELLGYIPLSLRLADPDRISYYMIGWDALTIWEVPGYSQAKVFLPDRDVIRQTLQQAIDDVTIPGPLTNQVQTLEAQLTEMVYQTRQPTATGTPTQTGTPTPIPEATATGNTPTPYPSDYPPSYPPRYP
ncbi:MAG: LCP family protein [Chloroflexota bacterium]|nr:LCP family protein [Chloroflexota bacterium]